MSIHKLKLISVVLFIFTYHCGYSQKSPSKIGQEVPNLILEPILNYSQKSVQLDDVKNKIIIIDFWATWCSPCVKALHHLDSLQLNFKDDLRVFAVTSSDSYERIEKFLEKFETNLPIVIDSNQTINKEFPHRIISHTVIIGKDKKIKAVTTPEKVTEALIQKIIKGEAIALEEKRDVFGFDYNKPLPDGDNVKYSFKLTGYQEGAGARLSPFNEATGRLFFTNVGLSNLYRYSRQTGNRRMSSYRVNYLVDGIYMTYNDIKNDDNSLHNVSGDNYKKKAVCLEIIAPGKKEKEIKEQMTIFLHQNTPIMSKMETRKMTVKVLRRNNNPLDFPKTKPGTKKGGGASGAGIDMKNVGLVQLAAYLENFAIAGMPVVDETGDAGKYNIQMTFREEDPDAFYKELREKGLEVVEAEREIKMLILYEEKTDEGS